MAGEIASTGMNVHTSLQEGKTLPLKAHGSPPEMTRDRATEHWGGPRVSEQVWVACRNQVSEKGRRPPDQYAQNPVHFLLGSEAA